MRFVFAAAVLEDRNQILISRDGFFFFCLKESFKFALKPREFN